jgi:creatinine amidohydrolase
LIVSGHVGNASALRVAIDGLRVESPELRVGLIDWWSVDPDVAAETTRDVEDWHGNRAETSLMLALAPDLVDLLAAKEADDEDRSQGLVFAYTAKQLSRNGITGRPSEATAEIGIRLWTKIVESTVKLVHLAATEAPPLSADERSGRAPRE